MYCLIDGYYLLHGSILSHKNKRIALLGLDGVGKTSVSNKLCGSGSAVLADNFILYNGKYALALNLAMRLDPKQASKMEILYRDKHLREALPPLVENHPVLIDEFYLLSISDVFVQKQIAVSLGDLCVFLNNAPEIGQANNFLAPFLYMKMGNANREVPEHIKVTLFGIPQGKIFEGAQKI